MATALQSETVEPEAEWRIPRITVGRRLRWAREEAQLSAEAMALRLGVSPGTISNWESGKQSRNYLETIERWAEITRVPAVWILHGVVPEGITTCFGQPFLHLVQLADEQMELAFDDLDVPYVTGVTARS